MASCRRQHRISRYIHNAKQANIFLFEHSFSFFRFKALLQRDPYKLRQVSKRLHQPLAMHGHTKAAEARKTDEDRALISKKAAKYGALSLMLLKKREDLDDEEGFQLTGKALRMNPDFYTLWNYRRDILIHRHAQSLGLSNTLTFDGKNKRQKKISDNGGADVIAEEFRLTADAIIKNPKCYGAWYHRQWIAERFEYDRDAELQLCQDFLKADQRNFHCWIYRSFVVKDSLVPESDELAFSMEKLKENFSNYSAFHYRSIYIGKWRDKHLASNDPACAALRSIIDEELQLIENAIFTEPDDQSAWWYLRFVLSLAKNAQEGETQEQADSDEWYTGVLTAQVDSLRMLLEEEPRCKWCLLALADVLAQLDAALGKEPSEERRGLLTTLVQVDPLHKQRYLYLMEKTSS